MHPVGIALVAAFSTAGSDGLPGQRALEAALREAVAAACPSRAFAVDPDLTRAAQGFVRAAKSGRAPIAGSSLGFYAALETMEPAPIAGVATVSPPSTADRAVGDLFPRECRFNRAGVAAATLAGNEAVVALLTAAHTTDLKPIPGRVQPGAAIEIEGTLGPDLSTPRLFVSKPGGDADEQPLQKDGNRLRGRVRLAAKGEYTIEVIATGPGGPQVAAIRRVFAGVPAPESPPPEKARAEAGLAGVEQAIAHLRASHGLPQLARDPALDAVAQSHSREMAVTRVFAHVLRSDGTVTDRLRKAGYAYRAAGENIGLSLDALSAHEAVASSPAHLANLLDPHYRRLGLGAVPGVSPEGAEAVYLTEVLVAPIVGSRAPEGDVARVLQEKRRNLGLESLSRDGQLDALAAREVRSIALSGKSLSLEFQNAVVQKALEADPDLRSAVAEMFVGSSADETSSSRNVGEKSWTRLGVGAMYASSPAYGPGRLWVLILYAR